MFEKVSECPVCGGEKFKNEIICQDYLASGESFVLTDCESCQLRITNPRPDAESIAKYYPEESYLPHQRRSLNLFHFVYKLARSVNLKWKYQLINKLNNNPQNILDFGAGTGEFLAYMQKRNWQTYGVEPSNNARQISFQLNQVKLSKNLAQLPDNQSFSVITMWHVLEHIHELNTTLSTLKEKLTKNGNLIIALPNYHSYDSIKYKQHWAGYDVPRHLYHFNQETIKKLLKRNGLKIINTVPMKLDAYYVSILSEQNLKSKMAPLKGVITGYKSNQWASKNSNNYSSLVYITK